MSLFLYNLFVRLYALALLLVSPFNSKASKWILGRRNIFDEIQKKLRPDEKRIWFHCASLGEFEQGRPLIEKIKKECPEIKIVLSFFSPSGYEVRNNYPLADYVFYLPIDSAFNANKFISLINPFQVVFVKYEFWYHYINELYDKNIPLYFISSVFRPSQQFFAWYGAFFRNMLKKASWIFVQDQDSLLLLKEIGITNAEKAGDTRFDRVLEIASFPSNLSLIEKFVFGKNILVAGSTWPQDEKLLFSLFANLEGNANKFIIAPHEISEEHISELLNSYGSEAIRYSELTEGNASLSRVLIIDNIGLLASLYNYGSMAFVGGGFGKGVHNVLEAAVYGIPVFFGPVHQKSREAKSLVQLDCAYSIETSDQLIKCFLKLEKNSILTKQIHIDISEYFERESGATKKIFEKMKVLGF